MSFLGGSKSAGGQFASMHPFKIDFSEKILYLGGLSGHCSAVSAETPYSKQSTSRWSGDCHKTHSLWYTTEAPGFGLSPEPSSLLQGTKLQTGIKMRQLLGPEHSFIVRCS